MGSDIVGNEMRAKILISGIGALFTFIGTLYVYLIIKGRHNELGGPTIAEVRSDAVRKMRSETLLRDIARNDPNQNVRRTAARRLEELVES